MCVITIFVYYGRKPDVSSIQDKYMLHIYVPPRPHQKTFNPFLNSSQLCHIFYDILHTYIYIHLSFLSYIKITLIFTLFFLNDINNSSVFRITLKNDIRFRKTKTKKTERGFPQETLYINLRLLFYMYRFNLSFLGK